MRMHMPWVQVEPVVGRAAFFSSGWENVHGIRPVLRGARWAFTAAFMVHDGVRASASPGGDFRRDCVQPTTRDSYSQCRQRWAAMMTQL